MQNLIRAILFDFGGVIAEEGFYKGLIAIGEKNGLDPEAFFTTVDALIYETGYLIGKADEALFWNAVRGKTGIGGSDAELRKEILKRFALRPEMIAAVDHLRSRGLMVAMLSDQTNWLEEIDRQLKASDFLVVLLSKESADSEMVQAEVHRAYEYRKLQDRPRTLPVRTTSATAVGSKVPKSSCPP